MQNRTFPLSFGSRRLGTIILTWIGFHHYRSDSNNYHVTELSNFYHAMAHLAEAISHIGNKEKYCLEA